MAASHPPESVSFVLIDYKGGAAFAECAGLPHVAGVITDLDAALTARALQSLNCEIRRREALFAAADASDIESYRTSRSAAALPRLVLVVDEFAALAEDLPDFLRGLVGVAQRGRSLGLHLVLATQRPGGVVSTEIRANTSLRIALRVNDASESLDVIGTDAAAAIDPDRPGRAYLWTGSQLTQMQVARVSGSACERSDTIRVERLGHWREPANRPSSSTAPDDLSRLVDSISAAAAASGRAPASAPWLQPLPDVISHEELPEPPRPAMIHIGLLDLPEQQAQPAVGVDLDRGGTILFVGSSRTGRSTSARCIAFAGAAQLMPDRLHLYAIGADLVELGQLPHCGTAVDLTEMDTVVTLLRRFDAALSARHADGTVRRLLILDGWEEFVVAADHAGHGQIVDLFIRIARQAGSAGATVIVTGDRAALGPQLSGVAHTKYLLRLADAGDYGLAGLGRRAVPKRMPPGRALLGPDGIQAQFATAPTPPAAAFAEPSRAHRGTDLIRLRPLPALVHLRDLPQGSADFMIGVGGDAAEPISLDLHAGSGRLLITGAPQSGRTTSLGLLLRQAIERHIPVLLATSRSPGLERAASAHGVPHVRPNGSLPAIASGTLVLVDDGDAFLHTPPGDAIAALSAQCGNRVAVVAAVGSGDIAMGERGLVGEMRAGGRTLILHRSPTGPVGPFGPLSRFGRTTAPPGRGVLVDTHPSPNALAESIPVQVAYPDEP
jgi:S-DNA-T family DNA segregation ATPase FtsK/SpoIIIE